MTTNTGIITKHMLKWISNNNRITLKMKTRTKQSILKGKQIILHLWSFGLTKRGKKNFN